MKRCGFSEALLSAYFDSEVDTRDGAACEHHLAQCSDCQATLESWRQSSAALNRLVDEGAGEVDPLLALSRVRARIAVHAVRAPTVRLAAFWHGTLTLHRRALVGVALAMGLGALSAPFVVLWAGRHLQAGGGSVATWAGVIIESMEWGGTKQAVVHQSGDHSTTLIWVEPDADAPETHQP